MSIIYSVKYDHKVLYVHHPKYISPIFHCLYFKFQLGVHVALEMLLNFCSHDSHPSRVTLWPIRIITLLRRRLQKNKCGYI